MKKIYLSNYKGVILAGGKGTRLYPVTKAIPKPLLPVKGKPIINYLVDLFLSFGIRDIALLINKSFKEDFDWWEKRYYPENKIKFGEETEPLGTFGGLWYLKKWLSGNYFFLSNGDELKKINLVRMSEFHQKMVRQAHHKIKPIATVALVQVPNPKDYGVAICKQGLVQKFLEKPRRPPSKYINAGLYLFSPEIFNYPAWQAWHTRPKFLMVEKDIFPKLAKEGKLAGFKFQGKWLDCGNWNRYAETLRKWR